MQLLNTHPIKKSDLGFHGNLFGGKLMAWIDAAAAAYAMEFCHNRRMVTVCIDKCVFKKLTLLKALLVHQNTKIQLEI
jgi:acyl-CoA thioesterase YciA